MNKYTAEQVEDTRRITPGVPGEMLGDLVALLRERESVKAEVTDREAFSRGYVRGYAAALGAAASECRRQAGALDHGGNEYIRYADAIKCAAAIGSLRAPELNELSGNSGQLPMLASARVPDSEWLELADVLDKFPPTGGPGPLWGAGASFAYSDVAKTIRAKLAAAPKPETEE